MTRRRPGQTLVLLAVLTITGVGVSAGEAAEKPGAERPAGDRTATEKAREHFRSGEAFFKLEKYKEALSEYEQGYIAKSDASFLYNIAQCHRLMGNKQAALRFYKRFLTEATRVPNREMVEAHIRDLEKALAKGPPGARAPSPTEPPASDTSSDAGAPSSATSATSSGPAGSTTLASSAGSSQPATASGGGSAGVDLSAPAPARGSAPIIDDVTPSEAAAASDQRPIYKRWWFWTAIGAVAVAGGITAIVLMSDKGPTCEPGRNCM